MAGERKLQLVITADAKQAQKALGNLERTAGSTGKKTEGALSGIQRGLVGLGAAGLAVGAFKAFEDSERIARQTEAVLKSTGNQAGVTVGELDKLTDALSKKGGVDDELIQSGENMLLTFTKVRNEAGKGNDIFTQATEAANDYAAATGTDVVAANKMLGKALNDPIKGLAALTKAGVSFTQQQKDQIKEMVESGDTLGAQKIILREFATEYGGSLEANATASGKAKVAVDNMAESVGGVLAPALGAGAKALGTFADGFSQLPKGAQTATVGIVGLTAAVAVAGPKVMEMASVASRVGTAAVDMGLKWSGAVQSMAVDQGISRTAASVEVLKSGMRTSVSDFGYMKSGALAAAAGITAFQVTLNQLESWAKSGIDVKGLSTDLDQLSRGVATTNEVASAFGEHGLKDLGDAFELVADGSGKADGWSRAFRVIHGDLRALGESKDVKKAQNQINDLDTALAEMVTSGNAKGAKKAYMELTDALRLQGIEIEDVAGGLPKYGDAQNRAAREARGHKEAVKDGAWSLRDFGDAAKTAASETDYAAKRTEDNKNRLIELAAAAKEAESRIDDFYDAQHRGLKTQIDVEEAWDKYRDSLFTNGKSTDIKTPGGRSNQESLIALTETMLEATKVERDRTAALGDGTYATEAAIQKMQVYSLNLQDTMIKAGYTKDEVKVMIEAMGLTPAQIKTVFESNQVAQEQELRKGLLATIFSVPTDRTTNFHANTKPAMDDIRAMIAALAAQTPVGTLIPSPYGPIPGTLEFPAGKARGGPVSGGTTYMVGERGPELFTPRNSGTIIPNHRLRSAASPVGSGGSTTVVIQLDGREISRRVINTANGQTRRTGRSPLVAGGRR